MKNRNLPKLDLNITNRCNFSCTHCAFDSGFIEIPELTIYEIEKILKETKEIGGKRFDITGGEPLVRTDLEEIITIGKKLEYKIELVTNGSLLTEEKLNKFKQLGLDGIAISLDGSNEGIYNRIRKRDESEFYNILANIRASKRTGFYTKINTTVFQSNFKDIPNIIDLALALKVDELGLYYFTPIGRGSRSLESSVGPIKWLNFIKNELVNYKNSKLKISPESIILEKQEWNSNLACIANTHKSHLQILPNGNVYPCAILASYGKPIANLRTTSIKDIWNNEPLWAKYWEDLSPLFKNFNGCCIDLKRMGLEENNSKDYYFVCPIRKLELGK